MTYDILKEIYWNKFVKKVSLFYNNGLLLSYMVRLTIVSDCEIMIYVLLVTSATPCMWKLWILVNDTTVTSYVCSNVY